MTPRVTMLIPGRACDPPCPLPAVPPLPSLVLSFPLLVLSDVRRCSSHVSINRIVGPCPPPLPSSSPVTHTGNPHPSSLNPVSVSIFITPLPAPPVLAHSSSAFLVAFSSGACLSRHPNALSCLLTALQLLSLDLTILAPAFKPARIAPSRPASSHGFTTTLWVPKSFPGP